MATTKTITAGSSATSNVLTLAAFNGTATNGIRHRSIQLKTDGTPAAGEETVFRLKTSTGEVGTSGGNDLESPDAAWTESLAQKDAGNSPASVVRSAIDPNAVSLVVEADNDGASSTVVSAMVSTVFDDNTKTVQDVDWT